MGWDSVRETSTESCFASYVRGFHFLDNSAHANVVHDIFVNASLVDQAS